MFLNTPIWMWSVFFAIVAGSFIFDLGLMRRERKALGVRQALLRSVLFFALAMGFNWFVYLNRGQQAGYEFFMGYLIELSLSVDNLFVFLLIFTHFAVPREYQHRVLIWGILGAILLRGAMIWTGSALISQFSWVIYVFGAFLIITGIKMLLAADHEPDVTNNRLIHFMRRHFRITEKFEKEHFFIRRNGQRFMTPLFLVLVLIEVSDLIFAVDSIPAIFAITHDTFIIFTSNIFAILGLRSLYFALAAFIHRFEYLKYGLSIILVFIGGKMLINHFAGEVVVTTEISLAMVVVVLVSAGIVSVRKTRGDGPDSHHTGWVPWSTPKEPKPKPTTNKKTNTPKKKKN
jgi:tellurite resistance protein TerC